MDHMMPDMDGVEATRYIRAKIDSEYARSIPIIALTANALVGSEEMFLNNGFQALIAKPIDIMRLDTMIGQYVRNKEREKEISLQEASGTLERRQGNDRRSSKDRRCLPDRRSGFDRRNVPRQHIEGIDLIAGLERFGGDVESYWEVIESYVLNTPALLDKLNECLESDRMQDYGITVHGVKGSSRAICANDVGEVAEELERAAKAGNLEYVRSRHRFFIDRVQQLVDGLTEMLEKEVSPPSKPSLECPDRETLMQLLGAAEVFDIDGVDEAMLELESYEYEQNGELVDWLREQISIMGFKKIVERLKSLDEEGDNNDSRQQ
jgi:CheY-like chemotaxis protein